MNKLFIILLIGFGYHIYSNPNLLKKTKDILKNKNTVYLLATVVALVLYGLVKQTNNKSIEKLTLMENGHFDNLNKFKDIKFPKNKRNLKMLVKTLSYIKTFENIRENPFKDHAYDSQADMNADNFEDKRYKNMEEIKKDYPNIIDSLTNKLLNRDEWINKNQDMAKCKEGSLDDQISCLDKEYLEQEMEVKRHIDKLKTMKEWKDTYVKIFLSKFNEEKELSEKELDNIKNKFFSKEIDMTNLFYIYRLHSMFSELSKEYYLSKCDIDGNECSNKKPVISIKFNKIGNDEINKSHSLFKKINLFTLLRLLINEDIITKKLLKEMLEKEQWFLSVDEKKKKHLSNVILEKIKEIYETMKYFDQMSHHFISFDFHKTINL